MNVQIEKSWKDVLATEFELEYFHNLTEKVRVAYLNSTIYPPPKQIFNAFELCSFDIVKVVILGQDPYHGQGQAHGLAFSVPDDVRTPPSLLNIFKEVKSDLGVIMPNNGNLERWAKQGVLLLNTTLTVEQGLANSHQNFGWEKFTDAVIKNISDKKNNIVFLLWGTYAISKKPLIDADKHLILTAPHPSPFSAHRGFLGCQHFSQTNEYLGMQKITPIIW